VLAPWLLLEAGLGGGFLQERYRYSDAGVSQDSGVLHDPLVSGSLVTNGVSYLPGVTFYFLQPSQFVFIR